jgi:hypothetical protein
LKTLLKQLLEMFLLTIGLSPNSSNLQIKAAKQAGNALVERVLGWNETS